MKERLSFEEDSPVWSESAHRLKAASLGGLVRQFAGMPDVITLHAGLPPPVSFPVTSLSLTAAPCGGGSGGGNGHRVQLDVHDLAKVAAAQQYSFTGHPPLVDWAKQITMRCHSPPLPTDVTLTNGAVHALSCLINLLTQPGDTLVVDEYTYTHALECLFIPAGLNLLPVRGDADGMDPVHLEQQLTTAAAEAAAPAAVPEPAAAGTGAPPCGAAAGQPDASGNATHHGGSNGNSRNGHASGHSNGGPLPHAARPPRLLYTIPTGHNPTGTTMPPERKRAIYEVCRRFNLIILEDDAYYFLQFPQQQHQQNQQQRQPAGSQGCEAGLEAGTAAEPASASSTGTAATDAGTASGADAPGLQLPPSFLSLDVDGRVIRIDTLAKVLGPGYRLGWVSGPPLLVAKLSLAVQASVVGPPSLSQVVVSELLQHWGTNGFEDHVRGLQRLYASRAAAMAAAAQQHLSGVAQWVVPRAGMFMWVKLTGAEERQQERQPQPQQQQQKQQEGQGQHAQRTHHELHGDARAHTEAQAQLQQHQHDQQQLQTQQGDVHGRTNGHAAPEQHKNDEQPPPPPQQVLLPAEADVSPHLIRALVDERVVAVPGSLFWSDMQSVRQGRPCPYLRLTFAGLEEPQLVEGVVRLGRAIRAHHAAAAATAAAVTAPTADVGGGRSAS